METGKKYETLDWLQLFYKEFVKFDQIRKM
jgi:hypothetical protein